jgi:hypothetical protein
MHFASTILMVRPATFGYNEQTAINNLFQQKASFENLQQKVLEEFDGMVALIRSAGIEVIVINDTPEPIKPDAVFPNNWFCAMPDGSVSIFPMHAQNRRIERRADIIEHLQSEFQLQRFHDFTETEAQNIFLEGTGSMVMDHEHKIIYACLSDRTHLSLLDSFADKFGYTHVTFKATDKSGLPIYHTNVLMCIGHGFTLICDEIIDESGKESVMHSISDSGKETILISYNQMLHFAGNMLQLQNAKGEFVLVMSKSAFESLTETQKQQLSKRTNLLPVDIKTIETIGGGSARCMMAEIFAQPYK